MLEYVGFISLVVDVLIKEFGETLKAIWLFVKLPNYVIKM